MDCDELKEILRESPVTGPGRGPTMISSPRNSKREGGREGGGNLKYCAAHCSGSSWMTIFFYPQIHLFLMGNNFC